MRLPRTNLSRLGRQKARAKAAWKKAMKKVAPKKGGTT